MPAMPTYPHPTPAHLAYDLAEWIDGLNLPPMVRNTLMRDLDAVVRRRVVAGSNGHLRGLTPATFRTQLDLPDGGVVALVRGMGVGRIAELRARLAAYDEQLRRAYDERLRGAHH
jgi:hypothetical protein